MATTAKKVVSASETIKVGDKVRSFDFPDFNRAVDGDKACYVEGMVMEIGPWDGCAGSCRHYHIMVTKRVVRGKAVAKGPDRVYPVINGQSGLFGKTNGVEKIK